MLDLKEKEHMKKKTIKTHPKKMTIALSTEEDKDVYEKDFSEWAKNQARHLQNREFDKLDIENLREEIEDLSKRERDKLVSHLENLLMHLLKVKYQKQMHTVSWDLSIKVAKFKANEVLSDNPSLKAKLKTLLPKAYYTARLNAIRETGLDEKIFPEECEWKPKDLFENLEKKYQ